MYIVRKVLSTSSRAVLYRGTRAADGQPVVLKVLAPQHRPQHLAWLRNEYEIGKALNLPTAVKSLALETYEGRPALVMEDFGGESLARTLGAPMEVGLFLRLAIRIASAVADIHQQNVVHKNLKPENILVHPATGEVKIADFGLASRIPCQRQESGNIRRMQGSLPYMSPEHTGRTNRTIDPRSDLYSLGVTFYQMLTDKLPFQATDPLEWVHCHIARSPMSLAEIVPSVPGVLSASVMKLLAKEADDRYQTARSLQHDLERCLEQWSVHETIEPFDLGEGAISHRFQLPQKFYGRDAETTVLLRAFERIVDTGSPELVLVSGYAGIGKSSLVHELQKPIARERGFFASGKFDQYKRDIPHSTLVQAFRELVLEILAQSEERIADWRQRLLGALGSNGQLLADVIPQLELVIGRQPPVAPLPPTEAQNRFHLVLQHFLGVFAQKEHPLALFLDDLQWADSASLEFLQNLMTHSETRHLLVIGAYRDNEVTPSHALTRTLDRVRREGARTSDIALGPLSQEHLATLVADTLHCRREDAVPLSRLVYEKTAGNPFFAIQFLTALHEEGLIEFDGQEGAFRWDVAKIHAKGFTDNVVDLVVGKLLRLPEATQEALKQLACLGNTAEVALLALVHGVHGAHGVHDSEEEASHADLEEAVRAGFVLRINGTYKFLHDRIQEAAYLLLPEARRSELHLRIGRLLVSHTPPERLDERIFDIVTQLNLSSALITDAKERTQLAALNLRAARKAKAAAAYRTAVGYLVVGSSLLSSEAWECQYELTYALSLERAECEFLSGAFDEAERLFPVLSQHARSRVDKASVCRVKIETYTTKGEDTKAIACALECLQMFGICMSPHPSTAEVEEAYQEVWKSLDGRRIEDLIDLPLMTDPEMQAAMEILARLYAPAYHSDNNLLYLHLSHGVNISLRHGNAAASVQAYGWFGLIVASVFHRYQEGFRFAKLAFELMERHHFLAYKAKANFQMRLISYWMQPLDTMLQYSRASFEAAVETGDVPIACFSCHHTVVGMILRGHHLSEVHREAERALDFVRKAGFLDVHAMIVGTDRFVQAMRGRTRHLATYDDNDGFSEAHFESELAKDRMPTLLLYYHAVKLMARFMAGDYEAALAAGEKSKPLLWAGLLSPHCQYFYLYYALTLAAVWGDLSPEKQKEALDVLAAHREMLQKSAEAYRPTFHHAYALLSAEIARIKNQGEEAMRLYEEAIRSARENGFAQNEGLAHELAARFYQARGFNRIADTYLHEARACYARWGADGKVRQLERLHPRLVEERSPLAPTATFAVGAEQMDVLSVVKASQAISGEIVLEHLLRRLVEVVIEQAGAQKGYVVLQREGSLAIEAEALVDEKGAIVVKLLHSRTVASSPLLPASIIRYVERTKQRVLLSNAVEAPTFSSDEYIVRSRPASVLCLPIQKQAELIGLLYLENNLVTGAFPIEQIEVLELLASQAAISLESALLLAKEKAARTAAEEAERRTAFLAETSARIGESLDYKQVLERLASSSVRDFADWCIIDLIDEGELKRLAGRHVDPARQALLEELERRYPLEADSPHPSATVIRTGESLLLAEITEAELRARCSDDEHRKLIRALGTRTALVVPLIARGKTIGAIAWSSARPGHRYGRADMNLAQELAHRAAIAIENARLHDQTVEALRLREEFLSVASHELRTPMMSLTLALQAMLQEAGSSTELRDPVLMRRLVELAFRQGQRLNRLIDDLLDVSRIAMGKLPLDLTEVDLTALVREVVQRFALNIKRSACTVSIHDEGPAVGRWDRSRLDQVVMNLLSNAVKFGGGKPVDIHVGQDAETVRLIVKDRGIGIDPAQIARIFERFGRAVSARHYGGLGLGLYIARSIVAAHNGSIRVASQMGAGATFTVELPRTGP